MSLQLQYTIVGIIILAAIVWGAIKVHRMLKRKKSSCCGCSLKDTCNRNEK